MGQLLDFEKTLVFEKEKRLVSDRISIDESKDSVDEADPIQPLSSGESITEQSDVVDRPDYRVEMRTSWSLLQWKKKSGTVNNE